MAREEGGCVAFGFLRHRCGEEVDIGRSLLREQGCDGHSFGVDLLHAAGHVIILVVVFTKRKKASVLTNSGPWLLALGGKENIKEVTAIGSRLSVNLVDKENIDREKLKELGVSSVLVMSNKVTLVIEDKAEKVAATIQKEL